MWVSHGTACCRKAGKVQGEKCLEVTKYTYIYINAYLYAHSTMQMCMHAPALSAHLHCNPCRCTLSCTHTHTHAHRVTLTRIFARRGPTCSRGAFRACTPSALPEVIRPRWKPPLHWG